MQLLPLFPPSYLRPSKYFTSDNYADIKPWVKKPSPKKSGIQMTNYGKTNSRPHIN